MRFIPLLILAIGCAEAPVGLKDQPFGEFESWGQGIEGFNPIVSGPVDTGDGPSGFTQYDGAYFGTYQLAVSYEGNNCSFSDIQLIINVVNGEIQGTGQPGTTDCGNEAKLLFEGLISPDTTASGTLTEDTGFIFEASWIGFVVSVTDSIQISGSFNEFVPTTNPGYSVAVSGSFIVEQ